MEPLLATLWRRRRYPLWTGSSPRVSNSRPCGCSLPNNNAPGPCYNCLGDQVSPLSKEAPHKAQVHIRRRYQFSSALKRMSTIASVSDGSGRKWVAAVKGAPETLKTMYSTVPAFYDETYRWYTRRGSRVLALGYKNMSLDQNQVSEGSQRVTGESVADFRGRSTRFIGIKSNAVFNSPGSWSSTAPSSPMRSKPSRCLPTRRTG
jgi:hypothetical protein